MDAQPALGRWAIETDSFEFSLWDLIELDKD
jgi:hypothetical protein